MVVLPTKQSTQGGSVAPDRRNPIYTTTSANKGTSTGISMGAPQIIPLPPASTNVVMGEMQTVPLPPGLSSLATSPQLSTPAYTGASATYESVPAMGGGVALPPMPVTQGYTPQVNVQQSSSTQVPTGSGGTIVQGGGKQYLDQARSMAGQMGIDSSTFNALQLQAETGQPPANLTPQQQQVYGLLQQYFTAEVISKAQGGQTLDRTNPWKESLYNQYTPQGSVNRQMQEQSDAKLSSMQGWLEQMSQQQIASQQAQLGAARDQQLAEIDKALQQAINAGEISVREAEAQYEAAKKQIHEQAYVDSEATALAGQQRGIGNSMQMLGLMQGDQARTNNLLNQNITTRDQQINAINNQLAQLQAGANIDRTMANANYNYGLAGATAEINANMMNNQLGMTMDEWNRVQGQQFQNNMAWQDQRFTQENAALSQQYQLEQMAKSFGYDLEKMTAQQRYQLEQMAYGFQNDFAMQQSQQQFQANQSALDRNIQLQLQELRQSHDYSMFTAQQQAELDMYDIEMARKLAQFQPGTPEYQLLRDEADWAKTMMETENMANFAAEIGNSQLANALALFPKEQPDRTNAKAVEKYNKEVEYANAQVRALLGNAGATNYLREQIDATGQDGAGKIQQIRDSLLKWNPLAIVPRTIWNAVKSP